MRARLNQIIPILGREVLVSPEDVDHDDVKTDALHAASLLGAASSRVRQPATRDVVGPLRVDLRKWCSPIEDQGTIGACTAHAVVGALEYFERKTRGESVDASRRFLYRVTRRYLGWEGKGDTGAFLRSAIKALRIFGAVPEQYWPYDEAKYDDEPEAFHYAYAQSFKALEYFRVPENVDDLKAVLQSGLPFVFGFTCFKSIFDEEVAATGVIPYPKRYERSVGGHAVMAVGFTDSHILIRNSWARSWGQGGYGYLPWTYFDSAKPLADDCWVLVNAAWMSEDEGEIPASAPKKLAASEALKTQAEIRVARPSHTRTTTEERLRPLIQVARGTDPLRRLPLYANLRDNVALTASPDAQTRLQTSAQSVSLYVKELVLLDSFDFSLFGTATNELYMTAICWDLSGQPPRVYPPAEVSAGDLKTYNLKKGERVTFVGDGLQLWPSQPVVGGLYLRFVVMESDADVKAIGKRIAAVHDAVKSSTLTTALGTLLTLGGTVSAPVLAAVSAAADVLTTVVASALQDNGDDLVSLFEGTYGVESILGSKTDRYVQAGAEIELDFVVSSASAAATKGSPATKKSTTKKTARKKAK